MSQIEPEKIVCEGCGRIGPYRPEFAGRKIRCKCGHIMVAPVISHGNGETSYSADASHSADQSESAYADNDPAAAESRKLDEMVDAAKADRSTRRTSPRGPIPPPPSTAYQNLAPPRKGSRQRWIILILVLGMVAAGALLGPKYYPNLFRNGAASQPTTR